MYYTNQFARPDTRNGFILPFILGGLVGGGATALTRPRPVIATGGPNPYGYYQPYPYYNSGPFFY